eukprot:TRINITY_DN12174_c0_g1_i2.p1 TRINITY_DN12174_c0_g1~~TRINITY_DN12174_c0_g1_i2.p1  ORF type:complete len:152 (+),score=48.50 TRINITY_DN12174_c0_g1_i2:31-456(+)
MASFNYLQVNKLLFYKGRNDFKQTVTFNMRRKKNFTRIDNAGQQLVKLKNYVALACKNNTHHYIVIFDTNDKEHKYAYSVVTFETGKEIRTLLQLSPYADVLVPIVNDNVVYVIVRRHILVLDIPESVSYTHLTLPTTPYV